MESSVIRILILLGVSFAIIIYICITEFCIAYERRTKLRDQARSQHIVQWISHQRNLEAGTDIARPSPAYFMSPNRELGELTGISSPPPAYQDMNVQVIELILPLP